VEKERLYDPLFKFYQSEILMTSSEVVFEEHLFTADHLHFYLHGKPFTAVIQELGLFDPACNVVRIELPAFLDGDLNWEKPLKQAQEAVGKGYFIYWDMDFGFGNQIIDIQESAHFLSYTLALQEFTDKVWNDFRNSTFGLGLYRGPLDLASRWKWGELSEGHFSEWVKEMKGEEDPDHLRRLFCVRAFAEYLHRMLAFLPDILPVFCLVDVSGIESPAMQMQLTSKVFFEHIHLGIKGSDLFLSALAWQTGKSQKGWIGDGSPSLNKGPLPQTAVCFPQPIYCSLDVLGCLDKAFAELGAKKVSFRIIPEELLTEQWDGIDTLVVISDAVSPQGKRKLQGFSAAGGEISSY
jgi:hypothetical protein